MQSLRVLRASVRALPAAHPRSSPRCLPKIYQHLRSPSGQWQASIRTFTRSASIRDEQRSNSAVPGVTKEIVRPPPAAPVSVLDRLPTFAKPIKPYLELTRIDKPIGTLLLYWPCAWSITMASTVNHLPVSTPLFYLVLFGTGATIMRGAGCTINDMWDSKIDKAVERTRNRPLARGDITQFQALSFLGLQLSAGLAILTQLNWYSIFLGASSLSLVVIYPFMKRITYYPQFVLGLAFNWGALLGWSAVAGAVDWSVAAPLYAGGIAWCVLYDTIYAHQDKKDDILVNVKSTALRFGEHSRTILTGLGTTFVSLLTYAGYASGAGPLYYLISCLGAASHLTWQLRTVDFDSRADCWAKFVSNGRLGGLVWAGMFADYLSQMYGWFTVAQL